jgi:flagellar protein FlaG
MNNLLPIQVGPPRIQGKESAGPQMSPHTAAPAPKVSVAATAPPESAAATPAKSDPKANRETLQKAVDHANQTLRSLSSNELQFSIDKETGVQVVKLTDKATGEVIRQIPSEEMLQIAKSIDAMRGSLVSQEA